MEKCFEMDQAGAGILSFWYDPHNLSVVECRAEVFEGFTARGTATPDSGEPSTHTFTANGVQPVTGVAFASANLDGVTFRAEFS